jgi:hypothetical protein
VANFSLLDFGIQFSDCSVFRISETTSATEKYLKKPVKFITGFFYAYLNFNVKLCKKFASDTRAIAQHTKQT